MSPDMNNTLITLNANECDKLQSKFCICNNPVFELLNTLSQNSMSELSYQSISRPPKLKYFIGIDPIGFGNKVEWRKSKPSSELFISIFFNETINSYSFKVCVFFAHCAPLREHLVFEECAEPGINRCNLSRLINKPYVKKCLRIIHEMYDVKFKIHERIGFKIYSQLTLEDPHIFKILSLTELTKYTIIKNLKKPISQSYRDLLLPRIIKEYIKS